MTTSESSCEAPLSTLDPGARILRYKIFKARNLPNSDICFIQGQFEVHANRIHEFSENKIAPALERHPSLPRYYHVKRYSIQLVNENGELIKERPTAEDIKGMWALNEIPLLTARVDFKRDGIHIKPSERDNCEEEADSVIYNAYLTADPESEIVERLNLEASDNNHEMLNRVTAKEGSQQGPPNPRELIQQLVGRLENIYRSIQQEEESKDPRERRKTGAIYMLVRDLLQKVETEAVDIHV
ncbi:uncharacterized protein KY384_007283 [Bacidia gigantensis]|uniref:uncharacterized protein n=1 Tax=Bacidia gigantensis TaxID=2732470 RepID=UPI001D05C056|nr:uncharacterized protein KY384_007283 [Bacidia gigantensis]KAG8528365.1 hypothetical protein KY384_007283 [Bacidia gigantensis]